MLPFLQKKQEKKDFFLAFLLKPFRVGAILFEEVESKLLIISTKEEEQEQEINSLSTEDLIAASDKVITYVENSLPEDSKLEKTIFAVPYDWIEDGKIRKEYLARLKEVCRELGLIPIGFIVSIEAIIHFLQEKEGAPISSIFVEVAKNFVFVYIVRAGTIIDVKSGEIEGGDIVKTVEKLLLSVDKVDVLPSKMVLLDYEGADSVQQEFISYSWSESISFLHVPQVVVLEKGFENEAVINGVANRMGVEVLQDLKAGPIRDEAEQEDLSEASSEEFGFMKDKDVAFIKKEKKEEEELSNVRHAVFGRTNEDEEELPKYAVSQVSPSPRRLNLSALFSFVSSIKLSGLLSKLMIPSIFKKLPVKGGIIAIIFLVIAFGIGFSLMYYNVILKAKISIFADEKSFDKDMSIVFSSSESGDDTIKISTAEEEVSGDKSLDATGKKETGEKAKGEVTLYNKTDDSKTFAKGTVVVGTNNLEFQLASDVSIASTSSFSTNFSNSKVKVEAVRFGKEQNLPSGSNFTVKNISTSIVFGKNDSAFSGGTKKETTVISKKDLDELSASLLLDLEKKALSNAKGKASGNEDILPTSLDAAFGDKKFSKKEGDEASSVSLSATVKFKLAAYSKSDMEAFIKKMSSGQIPDMYVLKQEDSRVEIKDIKVGKNESASANLTVRAIYVPKIDTQKLAGDLKGKSLSAAEKSIKSISGVSDVNIIFSNKLPFLPQILPGSMKNIIIEIKR